MDYFFDNYYIYSDYIPTDIYPIQYGQQQCRPDYGFGPCVRANYIIHYVYSGKGIFRTDSAEYKIGAGQFFLIKPNQLTYYKADSDNPWLYRWIEFNGSMTDKILAVFDTPVLSDSDNSIGDILKDIVQSGTIPFEVLMQKMWSFIAELRRTFGTAPQTPSEEYVRRAVSFIKSNIHKKITVHDIAEHIGIDRSYLCRLFGQYRSISPQQYIINTKMNAAAQYMKNTNISVSEAANSVGYCDYHVFNKVFKKHFGISPSAWKKKEFWEQSIITKP